MNCLLSQFKIVLFQGGLSTSAMVKISIEDINDNAPVFSPEVYNVTIGADHPTGQTLVIVSATDNDSGMMGQVEYVVSSGNEDGLFDLNPATGELSLYSALDKFPLFYQLMVGAVDGEGKAAAKEAIINIHVSLDTKALPMFDKQIYTFKVSEDSSAFSRIGRVSPKNGVAGVRMFIYPEEMRRYFDLNPSTGDLTLRTPLDHETREEWLVNVGAMSGSGHLSFTQVRIMVTDVNDNAPLFLPSLGQVYIPENSPVDTVVSAASASDADHADNGEVRYKLVGGNKQHFSINSNTGVLTTRTVSRNNVLIYEVALVTFSS